MYARDSRTKEGVFIIERDDRTFRADQPTVYGFWLTETDSNGAILQDGYHDTAVTLDEAREMVQEEVINSIRAGRLVR